VSLSLSLPSRTVCASFAREQLRKSDVTSLRVGCLALRPVLSIDEFRHRFATHDHFQHVELVCKLVKSHAKDVQLV
jgi:hypothetical protein